MKTVMACLVVVALTMLASVSAQAEEILGRVFTDRDGDMRYMPGLETPEPGVIVVVESAPGSPFPGFAEAAVTGPDGLYFVNVPVGMYSVHMLMPPPGAIAFEAVVGVEPWLPPLPPDPGTPVPVRVDGPVATNPSGPSVVDFPVYRPPAGQDPDQIEFANGVRGYVFHDVDADGRLTFDGDGYLLDPVAEQTLVRLQRIVPPGGTPVYARVPYPPQWPGYQVGPWTPYDQQMFVLSDVWPDSGASSHSIYEVSVANDYAGSSWGPFRLLSPGEVTYGKDWRPAYGTGVVAGLDGVPFHESRLEIPLDYGMNSIVGTVGLAPGFSYPRQPILFFSNLIVQLHHPLALPPAPPIRTTKTTAGLVPPHRGSFRFDGVDGGTYVVLVQHPTRTGVWMRGVVTIPRDAVDQTASVFVPYETAAPTLVAPAAVIVEANTQGGAVVSPALLGVPTVSDLYDPSPRVSLNAPAIILTTATQEVEWVATDASGNTATATQTVAVRDTTPPRIYGLHDITVVEGDAIGLGVPLATDLASSVVTGSWANDAPATFVVGTTVVTWTVRDSFWNWATATQRVTVVQGNTAPVATPSSATTHEDTAASFVLTGTDTETSALTFAVGSMPAHGTLSGTPPNLTYTPHANWNGTDTCSFTASDGVFTSAAATVTITVLPVNDPPLAISEWRSTSMESAIDITLHGTDVETAGLTFKVLNGPANGGLEQDGTSSRFTYTPDEYFYGSDEFTFTVSDGALTSLPGTFVITVLGGNNAPTDVDAGADQTLPATGPTTSVQLTGSAFDDDDDLLAYAWFRAGIQIAAGRSPRIALPPGTHVITLQVSDGRGGQGSDTTQVKVVDTSAPAIHCPDDVTVDADATGHAVVSFTDDRASVAVDLVDGMLTPECSPASGSTLSVGSHTVVCTATDAAGLTATCSFTVTVRDVTPPTITLVGGTPLYLECGVDVWADPGVVSADAADASLALTTTGTVDVGTVGSYEVTYTVRDDAGLTASVTRMVVVQDTKPPTITSVTASPDTLGPANHKMVSVTVSVSATDLVDGTSLSKRIVSVKSSEPENGQGDGDTSPDWQITGALTVDLRAERSGAGSGRTYTITVECADAAGNKATDEVSVFIPKSEKKDK